jgi:hypothetical protein
MGKRNGQDATALQAEIGVRAVSGTRANIVNPAQHIIADGNAAHATVTVDQSLREHHRRWQADLPHQPHGLPIVGQNSNGTGLGSRQAMMEIKKSLKQGLQVAATRSGPAKDPQRDCRPH